MKTVISNCEAEFVLKSIIEGRRLDGRSLIDGRNLEIVFDKEDGCCIVMLGDTRALATVSCELTSAKASRPAEGFVHVNLELSPMASPMFKQGRMSSVAIEASRLLERCIRDSKCIDLESLCIIAGLKVWAIRVDVQTLNDDGNTIECAAIAAISALAHFKRPDVTILGTEVTVHSPEDRNPIPLSLHHMPVIINLAIYEQGKYILVDPIELEDRVSPGKVVMGINAHQEICCMHLSGALILAKDTVLKCSNIAVKRAQEVTQIIRNAIQDNNYKKLTNVPVGFVSLLHSGTILGSKKHLPYINMPVPENVFEVEEDESHEVAENQFNEDGHHTEQLDTSAIREEVRVFLDRPQVAVFEGGASQWQLDESDDSYVEDEVSAASSEQESDSDKDIKPIIKKEKDSKSSQSENEHEEPGTIISKTMKIKKEAASDKGRGWYSKDAFFQ